MTIIVTYADGTSTTFTGCTGYANDGKIVKFTGQKAGDSKAKVWEINFALVRTISQETP